MGKYKSIIMFEKEYCGACKFMKKTMLELREEGHNVFFIDINTDEYQYMMEDFNVIGYPIFLFMNDDEEYGRIIGSARKEDFYKIINGG